MSVKVLVADDHHIIRQGVIELIKCDDTYEIVCELGDGRRAFERILKLKPDIAVLDISMPNMSGLDIAREIQKEKIVVGLIILTMHKNPEYFQEAMSSGVKGYLLKENTAHDLITALDFVSKGKRFISPLVSEHLVKINEEKRDFLNEYYTVKDLTQSERKILKLISVSKTSKEISNELSVALRTVQNHRFTICQKLNLTGYNALIKFAIENKSNL